jgi:cytochrome c-type biogenesis protein CcmH/NrfF
MLTDSQPTGSDPKKTLKNPLLYSSAVVALVLLVVGWVMISRWLENRRIEHQTQQEEAQKQRENDVRAVESLGGNELAIQAFYA